MTKRIIAFCAALLSVELADAAEPPAPGIVQLSTGAPRRFAIRDVAVLDVIGGAIKPSQTVHIEGERIQSVAPAGEQPIPEGTTVIEGKGKFLIPGLIDAHVHLVHLADRTHVTGDEYLPLFLAAGVTSVRSTGDAIVAEAGVAKFAEARPERCPRVFLASPLVDGDPPFHRDVGIGLTDPAKVEAFVDDMAKWNVVTIKLYVGTARPVAKQVIAEGHRRGIKITAHLGNYTPQNAAEDGIDCLEHIWSVFNYIIPPDAAGNPGIRSELDLNNPISRQLIEQLAAKKVAVDPTLVVFRNMIYLNDLEEVHRHPDVALVPAGMRAYWDSYRFGNALPAASRDLRLREVRKYQELTGLLHKSGVTILAGTDAPEPYVTPGFSLHQELEMLVESGLSPVEAIRAATINNARMVNQEKNLGTIEAGKLADMVLLGADPTKDIRNTRKIELVIRGGIVCNPAAVLAAASKN